MFGKKINLKIKENNILLLLILFFLPLVIRGENAVLIIIDNLDSELLYKYLLKTNKLLFNLNQYSIVEGPLNGVRLLNFHSQFNLYNLPFLFLDPFDSYLLNAFIIRLIGFFSFKYLCKLLELENLLLINLISISFSLLPVYTVYGITLLGLPLVLIAFFNINKKGYFLKSILFILLYVSYSVPFTYPGIILLLIIALIIKSLKGFDSRFFAGIITFIFFIILLKFPLILNIYHGQSHRELLTSSSSISILGILNTLFRMILGGGEIHPALFISFPITLTLFFIKNIDKRIKMIFSLIILIVLLSSFTPIIKKTIESSLVTFGLGYKILFLVPFLLYLSWIYMLKSKLNIKISLFVLMLSIILNFIRNFEFSANILSDRFTEFVFSEYSLKPLLYNNINQKRSYFSKNNISYNDYISKSLFNQIDSIYHFKKKKTKLISLGFDASVLLFNNFNTVDGYFNSHNKNYNISFDKIQTNSSMLGRNLLQLNYPGQENHPILKKNPINVDWIDLDISISSLKQLKCEYIFSSFRISKSNLNLVSIHENEIYKIYIYKL